MNENEALLVVERGPVPSLRFALQQEQVTIGRSAGNDLVLADPEISRRHARVVRKGEGFAAEDIGSTNGTFVNGQRISHLTLLQDGDTIDLGDTVRLRFISPAAAVPASPDTVNLADRPTVAVPSPVTWSEPSPAPVQPVIPPTPAGSPPVAKPPAYHAPASPPVYPGDESKRSRWPLLGCGLVVAMLLVCAGTFLILDTYDQGRLLYCGAARPIFELILGVFGFPAPCP